MRSGRPMFDLITRAIEDTELTAITTDNVDAFAKNWEKWLPK